MEKIIKEQIGDVIYYHAEDHDKRFYVKINKERGYPALYCDYNDHKEVLLLNLGYVNFSKKINFIYQVENGGIYGKGPGIIIKSSFKYSKTGNLNHFSFYDEFGFPRLKSHYSKPVTVVNGTFDDIFINRDNYIYDLKDKIGCVDKGGRISGTTGQLSRKHSIIYRGTTCDQTFTKIGRFFKEKNIILIRDVFPQEIFGCITTLSLEEITYGIDANTLEVVTPIYSMRQQAFIDIEQDAFINNGGEYPSWTMGHFNESDFDATVVFKILAPLITIPTKGPDILNSDGNINDAFAKRLLLKK